MFLCLLRWCVCFYSGAGTSARPPPCACDMTRKRVFNLSSTSARSHHKHSRVITPSLSPSPFARTPPSPAVKFNSCHRTITKCQNGRFQGKFHGNSTQERFNHALVCTWGKCPHLPKVLKCIVFTRVQVTPKHKAHPQLLPGFSGIRSH